MVTKTFGESPIMTAPAAARALRALGSEKRARELSRFFKTGPGDYGEGDRFLGVGMPPIRKLVRRCRGLGVEALEALLASPVHEDRMLAVCVLVDRCRRRRWEDLEWSYEIFMGNLEGVNNWDLVDVSTPHVVGGYLFHDDAPKGLWKRVLMPLARDGGLWERRVAMLATFESIRRGDVAPALAMAEVLVDDEHDLMHKAVGWGLRELGKRDMAAERRFLDRHCRTMPRTMLRYAIERFPEGLRQSYLRGRG